eukprot:6486369-Prymnesium_polylepis.1
MRAIFGGVLPRRGHRVSGACQIRVTRAIFGGVLPRRGHRVTLQALSKPLWAKEGPERFHPCAIRHAPMLPAHFFFGAVPHMAGTSTWPSSTTSRCSPCSRRPAPPASSLCSTTRPRCPRVPTSVHYPNVARVTLTWRAPP